jgi:hypothetical protein
MSSLRRAFTKKFGREKDKSRPSKSVDDIATTSKPQISEDPPDRSSVIQPSALSKIQGTLDEVNRHKVSRIAPLPISVPTDSNIESGSKKDGEKIGSHSNPSSSRQFSAGEDNSNQKDEAKDVNRWQPDASIRVLSMVKESGDLTPISGPLKATCGIMIKLLEIIKVSRQISFAGLNP